MDCMHKNKVKDNGLCSECSSKNRSSENAQAVKTISAENLLKKMKTNTAMIVVNVLSQDSYSKCHIKDSISVPLSQLQGVAQESWDLHDEIVVYCANYECPLSSKAFIILDKLGFTNVLAYEGGIEEWSKKKYPVVGEFCNF